MMGLTLPNMGRLGAAAARGLGPEFLFLFLLLGELSLGEFEELELGPELLLLLLLDEEAALPHELVDLGTPPPKRLNSPSALAARSLLRILLTLHVWGPGLLRKQHCNGRRCSAERRRREEGMTRMRVMRMMRRMVEQLKHH